MASIFDLLGDTKETSSKSIVGSLFGLTPELVAQQQAMGNLQSSQNTAMQYAQLDPMQRAQYAMFQGASGATGGLLNAVGPESAQVQRAKQEMALRQAMADKGISLDNPQGFVEGAKLAMQMNLPDIAAKMGMAGAQLDKEMATAQKARFIEADKKADLAIYNQFLAKFGGDEAKAATAFNDYKQQQAIQQKIAGRTVVNVNQQQESQFAKTLGEEQGKRMGKAYEARDAAVDQLGTLKKMSDLNEQQLISGTYASGRVGAANLLVTMGLASPEDVTRLSNSQQFAKLSKDLVVANLKKMGYNPSNADQQFISATVAQLETSPQARSALIKFQADRANGAIAETNRMEAYGVKNKSLNGYVPIIPNFNPTGNTGVKTGVQALSNEELAAQIARLKGNK